MNRLLIIHPEGNIYNNPNVFSMITFLSTHYKIDILIPQLEMNNTIHFESDNIHIIEYSDTIDEIALTTDSKYTNKFLSNYINDSYNFILGIDRIGLILAYLCYQIYQIPYALVSYEILFKKETSKNYKKIEKTCSKHLAFAIVQDKIRAKHLSKQNDIPLEKMLLIPVASEHSITYSNNKYFHKKFNLSDSTKILLFIGTISEWSGIQKLLSILETIPQDWVIVLHDRYGNSEQKIAQNNQIQLPHQQLYFSNQPCDTTEDMHTILHGADLGLALYYPTYKDIYVGNNIKYIGLSSGKIATYLQNGLPIITNNKLYKQLLKEYKIGFYAKGIEEVPKILANFKDTINDNCIKFFNKKLNFIQYKNTLLQNIQDNLNLPCEETQSIESFCETNKPLLKHDHQYFRKLDLEGVLKKRNATIDRLNKALKLKDKSYLNKLNILLHWIHSQNEIILYGAGTQTETLLPLLEDKVLFIVDKNKKSSTLEKKEILSINTLKDFTDKTILVTPLGYKEEINSTLLSLHKDLNVVYLEDFIYD